MMDPDINQTAQAGDGLPIARNENVEFSAELAGPDDWEAQERAARADARQAQGQKG